MTIVAQRIRAAFFWSASVGLLVACLSGCMVGPNYKRPKVDMPTAYRGLTPEEASKSESAALADEKWWEVFQDKELQSLIRTALSDNFDVRIAASRVLQAQAQLGIARADQYPSLNGAANIVSIRNPAAGPIPAYSLTNGELTTSATWNLDFWGRYRRATEEARAQPLTTASAPPPRGAPPAARMPTHPFPTL